MGLFYLVSRLTVTSLGTLYPIYLSYKAIKANDLASLETLLMYWVVMGAVGAAEGTVEWIVNWIPFYYEVKTVAILWLTLPQIQGSTYVYLTYIHPFFLEHEHDIDAALVEAKSRAKQAGLDYLRKAGDKVRELLLGGLSPSAQAAAADGTRYPFPSATSAEQYYRQPSTAAAPAAGQTQPSLATQLLRQYGPAAYAWGNALLHPMANRQPPINPTMPEPIVATGAPTTLIDPADDQDGALRKRRAAAPRSGSSSSANSTNATESSSPAARKTTQAQVDDFVSREKARRSAAAPLAPSPPADAAAGWALWGRRTSTPTQPAAAAASSPLAGERSLYAGYDEISPDEAPLPAAAAPKQSWFGWAGRRPMAAGESPRGKTE